MFKTFLLVSSIVSLCSAQTSANAGAKAPSAAEILKAKERVALATRLLTHEGIVASSGHVSMRIPGTDRVAVGPGDVSRDIVSPDDVVIVDLNSNQLEGRRKKPSETEIHTGIYRARPDVMSVLHTHPVYSVVFSVIGKPILPVTMHGAIFGDGVPVYDSVGHIDNRERGDGLAKALGNHRAVLIKMHGTAVVGKSLEEAFVAALQLEENAQVQLLAESSGKVTPMSQADIDRCIRESFGPFSIQKRWQYYLDKDEMLSKSK
jgi:L-fuculose-phosphate aldolase